MNFSFDANKAQQQPANPVNSAATTTGFPLSTMQSQGKPGIFSSALGGAAAPAFGSPAAPGTSAINLSAPGVAGTPQTGLSFGAPGTQNAGINFGVAAPGGFSSTGFGSGAGLASTTATTALGSLSFGVPKSSATPAATPVFSMGGSTASTPATGTSKLAFGIGGTTPAPVFSLGTTASTPAAPAASVAPTSTAFGMAKPAAAAAAAPAVATTTQPGLSLGATTTSTGFNVPISVAKQQPLSTSFGIGQTTATPIAQTTASTGFSSGGTSSTLASGFNLGSSTTPAISTGFSINKTTTTQAAPTTATTNAPQTSLGTVTTVSSSSAAQAGTMNFCQLEESINKWTLELEEQEKVFVNQATQVNTWDKLLIANGEKIATLNQEVERVKLEQQQLEHELDYVVGQQKELQDCLVPLEKELASLSVSDPERDYTYRLAENLDKQLKQMSQDLKEIIEHLNEANRSQDSSDPIVQIGKILNAHMNSLQWLDQRTSVLAQKIQQIDQMHQSFRQENERSLNLAYN